MAEEKEPTIIVDSEPENDEPSAPLAPQEAPEESREWVYVQIKPGETLESLAEKYERPPEKILEKNNVHPNDIRFGYWVFV